MGLEHWFESDDDGKGDGEMRGILRALYTYTDQNEGYLIAYFYIV
jgi:hypothetical protein